MCSPSLLHRDPEWRRVRRPEQVPVSCRHNPLAGHCQKPTNSSCGGAHQQQRRMWVTQQAHVWRTRRCDLTIAVTCRSTFIHSFLMLRYSLRPENQSSSPFSALLNSTSAVVMRRGERCSFTLLTQNYQETNQYSSQNHFHISWYQMGLWATKAWRLCRFHVLILHFIKPQRM